MPKSPEKISDLLPDRKNRRKHTARNVEMLQESLEKVGTGRSIVIDENNEVLAGNATVKAAQNIGLTKVKVIEVDGSEIVAVRRTGLTDEQKRDLAIYDNRVAEFAEWDTKQLAEDVEWGLELTSFFQPDELDDLLASAVTSEELSLAAPPAAAGEELLPTAPVSVSPSMAVMLQVFLTAEMHPQFKTWIKTLAEQYGTTTMSDTVVRAVREAAGKHTS